MEDYRVSMLGNFGAKGSFARNNFWFERKEREREGRRRDRDEIYSGTSWVRQDAKAQRGETEGGREGAGHDRVVVAITTLAFVFSGPFLSSRSRTSRV